MEINFIAVFVGAVVSMAIGFLWYSPILFGNMWVKLMGFTPESLAAAKAKGMGKTYAISFALEVVTAYVLAHLAILFSAATVPAVTELTFWTWLGFMMPVMTSSILWENKSFKLFALNSLHRLVTLLAMGIAIVLIA